jgi:hypothetical protein
MESPTTHKFGEIIAFFFANANKKWDAFRVSGLRSTPDILLQI